MSGIYNVTRDATAKGWLVTRVDQVAHIGRVATRREAVLIARMLAGWRGMVTINGKHAFGRARA